MDCRSDGVASRVPMNILDEGQATNRRVRLVVPSALGENLKWDINGAFSRSKVPSFPIIARVGHIDEWH